MRLNGRREILAYLGRRWNPKDRRGWRRTRREYVEVLHYLPTSHRVWTTSEELDWLDRQRSLTFAEVVAILGRKGGGLGGEVGGPPSARLRFEKLVAQIYPSAAAGKKGKQA